MPEKPGGSVSTAGPPSSTPLPHLTFSSNSDSDFLSPFFPNIEPISSVSSEKVMPALFGSGSSAFTRVEKPDGSLPRRNNQCPDRLADLNSCSNTNSEPEFVSPISALAMADNTDGSVSAREYPQGTSVIETQFPVGFNNSLPDSVTLGQKLPESVPLDDDDRTSLRGTADGGNEGMVERQVDEVIGIHVGTQPPRRENVEEIRDEIRIVPITIPSRVSVHFIRTLLGGYLPSQGFQVPSRGSVVGNSTQVALGFAVFWAVVYRAV